MPEFRIVAIHKTDGLGDRKTSYEVQKKFLFWFFPVSLKCHYFTHRDGNAHHFKKPVEIAMLTKRHYLLRTKEEAVGLMEKISNPLTEKYKGNRIERVFEDHTLKDVYVNRSYSRMFDDSVGYEFSSTLEGLKRMIDERTIKKTQSIIL